MLTVVLSVFWALVLLVVAFFAVRQVRTRRSPVPEFDRHGHDAVRQAGMNLDARGPNGVSQSGF